MSAPKIDAGDPGKAAEVAALAAVLYARVCGMNAENDVRKAQGQMIAYCEDSFAIAVAEFWDTVPKVTP